MMYRPGTSSSHWKISASDAPNQAERREALDQQLGLLTLLHPRVTPIPRLDRRPAQGREVVEAREEARVAGPGVDVGERPTPPLPLRPAHDLMQAKLQMHERPLTLGVGDVRVISAVKQVQHHRARTKVERHTGADVEPSVTLHSPLASPLLDVCDADLYRRAPRTGDDLITAESAPTQDRRQVVDVGDVVDHWPGWLHGAMVCRSEFIGNSTRSDPIQLLRFVLFVARRLWGHATWSNTGESDKLTRGRGRWHVAPTPPSAPPHPLP